MSSGHPLPVLPDGVRRGLTGVLVCSTVSCAATSSLLIYLYCQAIKLRDQRSKRPPQGFLWLVNLFVADFIQSFSGLFAIRFLTSNSVKLGPLCTIQAIGLISGNVGSAIWTFVITVHTFLLLAGSRSFRDRVTKTGSSGKLRWAICAILWVFIIFCGLYGLIFHSESETPYYDQAGAGWCYIGQHYFWERILFTYAFLFLNMTTLTVLYTILFFVVRIQSKNLLKTTSDSDQRSQSQSTEPESQKWEPNLEGGKCGHEPGAQTGTERQSNSGPTQSYRRLRRVSIILLIYPLLYFVLTLPLAVTRIAEFIGREWGLTSAYVGAAIFNCSGLANVLLYTSTRKGIITWSWLKCASRPTPPQFPLRPSATHNRSCQSPSNLLASSIDNLSNTEDTRLHTISDSESEQRVL